MVPSEPPQPECLTRQKVANSLGRFGQRSESSRLEVGFTGRKPPRWRLSGNCQPRRPVPAGECVRATPRPVPAPGPRPREPWLRPLPRRRVRSGPLSRTHRSWVATPARGTRGARRQEPVFTTRTAGAALTPDGRSPWRRRWAAARRGSRLRPPPCLLLKETLLRVGSFHGGPTTEGGTVGPGGPLARGARQSPGGTPASGWTSRPDRVTPEPLRSLGPGRGPGSATSPRGEE